MGAKPLPRKCFFYILEMAYSIVHFNKKNRVTARSKTSKSSKFAWRSSSEGGGGNCTPCTSPGYAYNMKCVNYVIMWLLLLRKQYEVN